MTGVNNLNKMKMFFLCMSVIAIIVLCDQTAKYYARTYLKGRQAVNIVSDFVVAEYAENTGGFLSVGSGMKSSYRKIVMIFIPAVIIAVSLIFIIFSKQITMYDFIIISAIFGGGIGNIIDRILFEGRVTDYLNFGIGNLRTGILNIADMAIFFGVILLMMSIFFENKREKNKTKIKD
jgi:signal peptidase II